MTLARSFRCLASFVPFAAVACGGQVAIESEATRGADTPAQVVPAETPVPGAAGGEAQPVGEGTNVPAAPAPSSTPNPIPAPTETPEPATCSQFSITDAIGAPGSWELAERVMGIGWLRFHVDASDPSRGTFDYLGDPMTDDGHGGGIFACASGPGGTMTIDEASRTLHLVFPVPCSSFSIFFYDDACNPGPADASLVTHFSMVYEKFGIESTEGIITVFPHGHCDAAFSSCSYF